MNNGEIQEHEGHEGFEESSQLLTAKIAKSDIIVVRGEDASHSGWVDTHGISCLCNSVVSPTFGFAFTLPWANATETAALNYFRPNK